MTHITVTVDDQAVRAYLGALATQLPRRVGFAMNATANDVQRVIQDSLAGKFRLRRAAFIRRTIYRKPGEDFPDIAGGKLVAGVRVNEDQDVLAKFEEGGTKTPEGRRLAVPIIRKEQPNLVITRSNRYHLAALPANLWGRGGAAGQKLFGALSAKGTPLILERVAKRRVRVIYALVPKVPIPKRLDFHGIAQRVIDREWPTNLQAELDEAVRRAAAP